ncbi:MAG TPA: hypothetical protein VG961_07350 [Ignavibacteria bacterium]|nr:hypothetical protein [Ignavibacteria bacterium]
MHKSKSVLLLSSFSAEEMRSFGDFVRSPYFNKNTRVTDLFEELKKGYPDFTSKSIAKEKLYTKLFKGKPYNDQVMKNLNTELFKLEREFLAHDMLDRDRYEKSIMLVTNLTTRDAGQLFDKESGAVEQLARENRSEVKELYLLLYRIEEERFTNAIINNRQAEATVHILKAGEFLIQYFLKHLLRLSINNRINEFSFNVSSEVNLADTFLQNLDMNFLLDYMEKNGIEHSIHIKLLYYAMLCNVNANDTSIYNTFKELLFSSKDKFTKAEFQHLLHLLESIIAQKINSGKLEFYNDLHETYDYELKNDMYKPSVQAPLTVMKYRNIYLSAMKAGKFDWAERFIYEYRDELQKKDRQSIVELSMAQLNFEKKNFEETLMHLQKVRTSQIFYKVDVKMLSLMALYELSHFETAIAAIESFKKLLVNNKTLTEQYREKNRNFLSLLGSLIRARLDNIQGTKEELLRKIENTPQTANKKWLIKKTEELK